MQPEEIFTADEIRTMRDTLQSYRPADCYAQGKWMVSPLNRQWGTRPGAFPGRVDLRDISMRTMEQMPGVVNSPEERLEYLCELISAGVLHVATSCFRRGHSVQTMRAEIEAARRIDPASRLMYGNPVRAQEMQLAAESGYGLVQIWNATYLGKAMPASAGAVYHRVWQGRDWRDLRFPADATEHIGRARRLVAAGRACGLQVSALVNLITYTNEDYIAEFCKAMAGDGACEVILADSSGGCGPEAIARLVQVARAAAPAIPIGVHTHNLFGLAVATSLAGARAGAQIIEVSVNGYEVGPAGVQASLASTAAALEALYGVSTDIDLSRMYSIAQRGAKLTGIAIPWNEPILGSAILETAGADEYEQEARFDPLIHSAVTAALSGAVRSSGIGITTGPLGMQEKLSELGLQIDKPLVEPILKACLDLMLQVRRPLADEEIRGLARAVKDRE
jgi:hypothetical protein